MRVAIQNPFAGQRVAETELSRRLYLAATHLGWQAAEVDTAAEIKAFQPDFVIALHNNSPKLAQFPTYGCMWNPPAFFEGTESFVKHVLTYDGYLTSSRVINRWLHHLLYTTPKRYFTAPFYTSCPETPYQPPRLDNPRLAYLGSNWDGSRFHDLFTGLDRLEFMQVYGNPQGWKHLNSSYQGALPYDGSSVLKTLNQAGVGLCLHRSEHRQAELPSMRIFEVVASGAVAICSDHPFIRSTFADTVLYVDPDIPVAEQIEQISEQMRWIQTHPERAAKMTAQAHEIFSADYTLEKLLSGILPHHQRLMQQKGFTLLAVSDCPALPQVEVIIRANDPANIPLLIDQLSQQTYPNLTATIVTSKTIDIDTLIQPYQEQILFKILENDENYRSTALWTGLQTIAAPYLALLDDTVVIYPNHIQMLVSLLEQQPTIGVAYAGNLKVSAAAEINTDQTVELGLFQPFNLDHFLRFEQLIAPHSFVARRSLLDPILLQDPQLQAHETLCLLFHLAQRSAFLFSYELTCETHQAATQPALLPQFHNWQNELSRLKFIFWHQEFAPGKSLQTVYQAEFALKSDYQALRSTLNSQINQLRQTLQHSQDQLQTAESTITAMKTSKFWQLRSTWLKLKQTIGL